MGLLPAECVKCKGLFMWFTGSPSQLCDRCTPTIKLNRQDSEAFIKELENPTPPNEALKKAIKRHREEFSALQKFQFTASDFVGMEVYQPRNTPAYINLLDHISQWVNSKLNEWTKNAPVVYGYTDKEETFTRWSEHREAHHTHKAILSHMEPLKQCSHESILVSQEYINGYYTGAFYCECGERVQVKPDGFEVVK